MHVLMVVKLQMYAEVLKERADHYIHSLVATCIYGLHIIINPLGQVQENFFQEKSVELGTSLKGMKQVADVKRSALLYIPNSLADLHYRPRYLVSVIIQLLLVLLAGTSFIDVVQVHAKVN